MIRSIELDCDSLDDIIDIVDKEVNVCLRNEERNLPWWEFVILSNRGRAESIVIFRANPSIGDVSFFFLWKRFHVNSYKF